MSQEPADTQAWVFVSHASEDLKLVRHVRNYLEDRGAAPLLFHLRSLVGAEAFWPIIEAEIGSRNFFLYCESPAAESSEWVRRERQTVTRLATIRPIRVGSTRVDGPDIDRKSLDSFLRRQRAFVSYSGQDRSRIEPFVKALRAAGFITFFDIDSLMSGHALSNLIESEIEAAARDGWVLVFLSELALQSQWFLRELSLAAAMGASMIPILLDKSQLPPQLAARQAFDARLGPEELARLLLRS